MTSNIADRDSRQKLQNNEVVLLVEGVSKKFARDLKTSLLYGVQDIATELSAGRRKSEALRSGEFWALKDVNLQLQRGESLALVGANGSGKTTLLRIISGLIKPDTGSVKVRGRVAPLIALGAGFSPILTGRENIYVNMSILGLSTQEIDQRFDAVVEFAEIGDAIDAPAQTYSSGMAARLGFATAIYTEPDILLIDEVLAVGDIRFKAKCFRRLAKLRERGTSFILVSHSSVATLSMCNSATYLSKGKLIMTGTSDAVISRYEDDLLMDKEVKTSNEMFLSKKDETSGLQIRYVGFRDIHGNLLKTLVSGEPARLCVHCDVYKEFNEISLSLIIREQFRERQTILFLESVKDDGYFKLSKGESTIWFKIPYCGLKSGSYHMKVRLTNGPYFELLDIVESFIFSVKVNEPTNQCEFYQPRSWEVTTGFK